MKLWFSPLLARLSLALIASAAPALVPAAVPEPLQPWAEWVLRDHPEHSCYRLAGEPQRRQCLWPEVLRIELTAGGARFRQSWRSQADAQWLPLPGARDQWPRAVTLDGRPAPVVERDGRPGLWVDAGDHEVGGRWAWERPPPSLALPPVTVLVDLRLGERALPVELDAENRLWLQPRQVGEQAADRLQIEVFRRIEDGVPVRLWTELRLAVSGAPREVLVGRALPAGAVPMDLESPLPARLEDDGRLRVQVRPGRWRLALESRYLGRPEHFVMEAQDRRWPGQEIWAFRAAPEVRGLRLTGAPAVDPSRLDLPAELQGLPVYLLTPESPLRAEEDYRGLAGPAADPLRLQRTLWLDFDGRGATVRDLIRGQLSRSGRLQARPELALGRVAVNGEPQVITRLPDSAGEGVELRAHELNVEAVSRLDAAAGPTVLGWERDFDQVALDLHLPPGWRLWHATGPDRVQTSWLAQWNLWDLFLCLLIAGASGRLLGWRWGLVAGLALALSYHERGAPVAGWVAMVIAIPLLGALPAGRLRSWLRTLALAALLLLALAVLGFAVQQLRAALYPQLEQRGPAAVRERAVQVPTPASQSLKMAELADRGAAKAAPAEPPPPRYRPDENAQTGPGEPSWRWRQVQLGWQGPVRADETLRLWLSPPWLGRGLRVLQVALVALLLFGLGRALWRSGADRGDGGGRGAAASLLGLLVPTLLVGGPAPQARADFPPPELLEQLRAELLGSPACQPGCAGLVDAHLVVDREGGFTLRLRTAAAAPLAVALPAPRGWQADRLLGDGAPLPLARIGTVPWTGLAVGLHDLELHGRIAGDSAAFHFPVAPQALAVSAPGWDVEGMAAGRLRGDTLNLKREPAGGAEQRLLPEPAPGFVRIERRLVLDLDWQLTTTVTRMAPAQGAINLEVPLLPDERVIGDHRLTRAGDMAVTLGAEQRQFRWLSLLPPADRLRLTAPETPHWVEVWQVEASPRWHVSASGLPAVKTPQSAHTEWRPWPGETLVLGLQRPPPVPGAAVTVERAELGQNLGARGADLRLELELRSSLGGDYRLALPVPGTLQRVEIDGVAQARPEQDGEVVLPLRPGLQRALVTWRLEQGVALRTATAPLVLPTPAANIDLTLQLPRDRWPLWLRGPDMGPAMLYWGVLVVVVAVALALGFAVRRLGLSIPLAPWQWLLLGIGMSTVNSAGSLAVVAWFFALEARRRWAPPARALIYNLAQVGLILLTLIAVASLVYTIPRSLLAAPDMQVTGNGSSHLFYRWYQDRSAGELPRGAVFSLPLWAYRLAMLAWSLWLVFALLRWARWGWTCFGAGGLWRPRARRPEAGAEAAAAPE
jgi:hypothetical protein